MAPLVAVLTLLSGAFAQARENIVRKSSTKEWSPGAPTLVHASPPPGVRRRHLEVVALVFEIAHHEPDVLACELPPGVQLELDHQLEPAQCLEKRGRHPCETFASGHEEVGVVAA